MLSNFWTRPAAPQPLPLNDSLAGLDSLCAIPQNDGKTSTKPRIRSENFIHIANLLKHYESQKGLHGWSRRPRIFTILHNIGRRDDMSIFILHDLLDSSLPFSLETLPKELGDSRIRFIDYQDHVLTRAGELEKGIGGFHMQFQNGDDHFHHHRHLGSGAFG